MAPNSVFTFPRGPPSQRDLFNHSPSLYIARRLYGRSTPMPNPSTSNSPSTTPALNVCSGSAASCPVTVVCISDTHNETPNLPSGDILVHAGDLTGVGHAHQLQAQLNWLAAQPHQHKIVIAGNHDKLLDSRCDRDPDDKNNVESEERRDLDWHDIIYLQNTSATITVRKPNEDGTPPENIGRTLTVFGSPLTPKCGNWAFWYGRDEASQVWQSRVPDGTDILVTHGPPRGHLDLAGLRHIGCTGLLRELWRVRPALSVFGHVHAGRGVEVLEYDGVQRLWEEIVENQGGWWTLALMCLEAIKMRFGALSRALGMAMGTRSKGDRGRRTAMVNAAHMAGFLEPTRDAIVVVI